MALLKAGAPLGETEAYAACCFEMEQDRQKHLSDPGDDGRYRGYILWIRPFQALLVSFTDACYFARGCKNF